MSEDEAKETRLKFLQTLKNKGKGASDFGVSIVSLQAAAASSGLEDDEIKLIADLIMSSDIGSIKLVSLVKCLIPRYKLSSRVFQDILIWLISSVNEIPITLSTVTIQWIIGLWDYRLAERKIIDALYDTYFFIMLKKERLERPLAHLIYLLTKPEDVSRRNVCRLLNLQQKYSKPQKHIIALLSLFKSYKPELVPEKIQVVNIENVWRPIPEVIRLGLEDARDRLEVQQTISKEQECFKWDVTKSKKSKKSKNTLVPSVGYFQIGSSIFKDKDIKSIFDVSNIEDLGQYQLSVELPCNILSLLANSAGYHLLTFAKFQYQSRFSYNLYNTLRKAFILESDKFSYEEKEKLLDMTIEFSQYMQQGVMVVNLFLDEYLFLNSDEHRLKIFSLLQWVICVSAKELQEKICIHLQNMFYELSLEMKCELIKSCRKLAMNLFVNQCLDESYKNKVAPFLGQGMIDNLEDVFTVFTKLVEDLIVRGLNTHNYDVLLLSESLAFYEEVSILESGSRIFPWTLAPPHVIYGGFVSKSCAILSRICALLLRYREINSQYVEHRARPEHKEKINIVNLYAEDLLRSLWFGEAFSGRTNGYFLRNVSDKIIKDLGDLDLDSLLTINGHYAFLPYKCTLSKTGLSINTREDALCVAEHYYSPVKDFIDAFFESGAT